MLIITTLSHRLFSDFSIINRRIHQFACCFKFTAILDITIPHQVRLFVFRKIAKIMFLCCRFIAKLKARFINPLSCFQLPEKERPFHFLTSPVL